MNKISEGIIIDRRTPLKARLSIAFSRESGSDGINESDLQFEKHDDPRISTFPGIEIDSSDEAENADDLIRVNRELIQMKLRKMIHNLRNRMIQEFQYLKKLSDLMRM
jgi:hypothetical protein